MPSLPKESWSFSIDDYAIQHQGVHVIDLEISYDYKAGIGATNPYEYPNFLPIAAYANNFLVNYPNETDFWEIVNRKLVDALLTQTIPTPYGVNYHLGDVLDNLSISLTVHGDAAIPYSRTSTVEQDVIVGTKKADHLTGGIYGDAMRGEAGNDWMRGLGGDDYLNGGAGKDHLFGGDGVDILVGGPGSDSLTGGADGDTFLFTSLADLDGRDHILDFMHAEGDKIDLSAIDAISNGGTKNDAFTLVQSFHGLAGELVAMPRNDDRVLIKGDVDGNGKADFTIVVTISTSGMPARL